MPELKRNADYLVLLANATVDESIENGQEVSGVQRGGGGRQPRIAAAPVADDPRNEHLLVQVGRKGMSVMVLGLYDGTPRVSLPAGAAGFAFRLSTDAGSRSPR